jgi:hypothetical protein
MAVLTFTHFGPLNPIRIYGIFTAVVLGKPRAAVMITNELDYGALRMFND